MACIPTAQLYHEAAYAVTDLLDSITPATWTGPGLGDLGRPLARRTHQPVTDHCPDLPRPARRACRHRHPRALLRPDRRPGRRRRGRRTRSRGGAGLGPDPAAAFRELHDQITERLDSADLDAVITTVAGGMRFAAYLPTRTFELVVHGLDIAAATGSTPTFSPAALKHATDLAGRIAVELGRGPTVLRALTGRTTLPAPFSIVG